MRALSQSLLRAQGARTILAKNLLLKCVLTYGADEYSYTLSRIKRLSHTEQAFSQKAELLLNDNDKVLHNLDLDGFKAVISYGLITRAGSEWIATAPLWVAGQDRDSYTRDHDQLECILELEGIFNRMDKQKARSTLTLPSTDTQTVEDLLIALAAGTITDGTNTPYSSYPAYTLTIDSRDSLINAFIPADGFRIGLNETRGAKWRELMRYTDCVSRVENDEAIHIFDPTTSGSVYDAEFSLVQGRDYHNFFNKRFRRRVVSPNKIWYESYPASGDGYSGSAADASAALDESSGGNGSMLEEETHYARLVSDAQGAALAAALLSKKQMEAEKGSAILPFLHMGLEPYDYTNVVDARAGDERAGNVGFLTRYYEPGQFNMHFGFGRVPIGVAALQGLTNTETGITAQNLVPLIESVYSYIEQIIDALGAKADINDVNQILLDLYEDAYFRKISVSQQTDLSGVLTIPSEAA